MVLLHTPKMDISQRAGGFRLEGVDNKYYSLSDIVRPSGFVVAFICNHCPYVTAVVGKIVSLAEDLSKIDVGFVAVNPNSASPDYEEDSPENMKIFAKRHGFAFPYLSDSSQSVAKAYGAVCTPDFFGFNNGMQLCYRGRLDNAGKDEGKIKGEIVRELLLAMTEVAKSGNYKGEQMPSMGCSIKWNRS